MSSGCDKIDKNGKYYEEGNERMYGSRIWVTEEVDIDRVKKGEWMRLGKYK